MRPKKIVAVAVARYEDERAARRALRESRARRVVVTPRGFSGKPLARNAWLEGNRFLVGLAVAAPTRQGAVEQLRASRRDIRAYVGTSRLAAYEAIALGPLLLLLAALFSARIIAGVAIAVVVIVSSLAAIAVALVGLLLYLPIALVRGRRRRARSVTQNTERPTFGTSARVHDLEPEIKSLAAENRAVLLGLAGLVGFGIAALTTSALPRIAGLGIATGGCVLTRRRPCVQAVANG